jgi:hypothetical protein
MRPKVSAPRPPVQPWSCGTPNPVPPDTLETYAAAVTALLGATQAHRVIEAGRDRVSGPRRDSPRSRRW